MQTRKVFRVNHERDADLIFFAVDKERDAKDDSLWFFVDKERDATFKIFWVERDRDADIMVFKASKDREAKWAKSHKFQSRIG